MKITSNHVKKLKAYYHAHRSLKDLNILEIIFLLITNYCQLLMGKS
jgi:hypothetical protein